MSPVAQVDRIVLVGFMAAGKSTVGRGLARALGWDFHDLDDVVEAREGRSVAAIFADSGEPAFREIEAGVAEAVVAWALADAFLEKFGGDCVEDVEKAVQAYADRIR